LLIPNIANFAEAVEVPPSRKSWVVISCVIMPFADSKGDVEALVQEVQVGVPPPALVKH
jgi:hypothetical protein